MNAMTIRRLAFEFPPDMERVFVKDDPQTSYMFLGAWMMLPYLEPFLIRTMMQALPHIRDEKLKSDLKHFCAQEGEHYKQHARANDIIRGLNPGFAPVAALEQELDQELKRFSKEKPLLFKLAYAEGFESMTSAVSAVQLDLGMYDRVDSPLADLAKWHVMEELEHRTVAFDVYHAIGGRYLYRVRNQIWAQMHYFKWVKRFADVLKAADEETIRRYDTVEAKRTRKAFNRAYWRRALPRILATYLPGYDPRRITLGEGFEAAQRRYSGLAVSFGRA
jgi:hypothetical protein